MKKVTKNIGIYVIIFGLVLAMVWFYNSDAPKEEKEIKTSTMIHYLQDKKVDLQLLCPSQMERDFSEIKNGIRQIVESNSLVNSHIYVEKNEGKLTLSEVFPKIKEGRNNINVTI